jgi:hypothetical protein
VNLGSLVRPSPCSQWRWLDSFVSFTGCFRWVELEGGIVRDQSIKFGCSLSSEEGDEVAVEVLGRELDQTDSIHHIPGAGKDDRAEIGVHVRERPGKDHSLVDFLRAFMM